jgi:UDP-GlcNAc:undecaprenyl-phosphate/decaprenyl-phosphate GlcNAc-1-phosphate transferase
VHWLPLVASFLVAAAIAPSVVRSLPVRENYRGARLAFPIGVLIVVAAFIALIALGPLFTFVDVDVLPLDTGLALFFVPGVAILGLLDDVFGSREGQPRGWRGHARALAAGQVSTGVIKAAGTLGLAFAVMVEPEGDAWKYFVGVAVLVLATHLFNLLDLRPGRSAKALALLGLGLTLGSWNADPFFSVSLFIGPILVLVRLELQELGMLGDTGSGAIGAIAGLWLVLTLSTTGQAIAAAVMALITVYGEFRSISEFVERTPGLRQLDSLGRSHA